MSNLAKLTRPKLHQVLSRERLFARLDDCRSRPLVWVMGPPGAGKTSLVASYLEASRSGGIWYQIDPGDHDLATFFHYLSRAALAATRKRRVVLPPFTAEHRADLPGYARVYFRALFECLKAPAVLVFDNYHELPADADLHRLFDAIAREVPDGFTVVATSRSDPPAECAALRALDRLAVLDWDELRLTLDETRRIAALRQVVDEDTVRGMHEHAGGWPVGLTLSLEQLKRGAVGLAGQEAQSRDVLFNYFAGQILAALPEDEREKLMRVALLPRADAAQAAAISEHADTGTLLESLYRKRLFVERRGDAYQFHDLFRAFLISELERTHSAEAVAQRRAAAARLLAAAEQIEAAFGLAARAGDWPFAISLVSVFAPRLFEQGRMSTLRGWFDALPPELVRASPWLNLWLGVALSPTAPLQARQQFELSYGQFPREDIIGRILAATAVLMTHYLEFDHGSADHWLDEVLPLLAQAPPFPATAAELRAQSALLFALSYQRPRRDLVDACLRRIRTLLPAADVPANARVDAATLMLAHYQIAMEFDEAERIVAMTSPWLADPEMTANRHALWLLQLAHFRVKQGRDADAERLYAQAETLARENALTLLPLRIYGHIGLAMIALAAGDADRAEAERLLAAASWTFARRLDQALDAGLQSSIAAHRGEPAQALACAREQLALFDVVGPVWLRCCGRLQLALAQVDAGSGEAVPALLGEARALLADTCFARLETAVDCVQAYAALQAGDIAGARVPLERLVADSHTPRGLFALRMHPRVLSVVFGAALGLDGDRGDMRRTIRDFALRPPTDDPPGWPWPFEVRMLGRFAVLCDGRPLEFSRKVPRKTLALLKAIVALGGRSVSEQRLIDTLWPEEEGDAAARALDATVLRLRALLGDANAVLQRGGRLSLDRDRVWIDVFAFEQALASAEAAAHARDPAEAMHRERALGLYRGAFLAEDEGEAWPVAVRERLRGRFIHALARQGETLEAAQQDEAAIQAYLRGIDADPAIESFYQGLMRCYHRLDRRSEAIAAYLRLKQILSITLGLAPSAASERLYQSLRLD